VEEGLRKGVREAEGREGGREEGLRKGGGTEEGRRQ
jgi:hypothetical protein